MRHSFIIPSAFLGSILCWISLAIAHASETVHYIHATPENTSLADGSPLPEKIESIGWRWLLNHGNSGVFESIPNQGDKPAIMMIKADNLSPGMVYEVFGYFWADGFDVIEPETRTQRPAQFGVTLASLQTFDGRTPPVEGAVQTWMVTPGSKIGEHFGYMAAVEENEPLDGLPELNRMMGKTRLIRARLGLSKADKDGTIPVFFADYPYQKPSGPSWIDGVAVRLAKSEMVMDQGYKPGTRLHLALRASDSVTIERELSMGVDLNGLDEDRLTPLYYAAASDDTALMRKMLDMGAMPEHPDQAIATLSAAVSTLNTEAVKILLDAGAQIPPKVPENMNVGNPKRPEYKHPVILAIRMGSVSVLKTLLESDAELKIESILPLAQWSNETHFTYFVANAILTQHWEMAEFLLDHGCGTYSKTPNSKKPDRRDLALLQYAVQSGKPAEGVIQRLIQRGISPVYDYWLTDPRPYKTRSFDYTESWGHYQIPVDDALLGAVQSASVDMVRRFLPAAKDVTPRYQDELYMIALYRDDPTIIDLVKNHFPEVSPCRWSPKRNVTKLENTEDAQMRLFLPRTSPLPTKKSAKGAKRTLAIISSPDAAGVSALLSSYASGQENWVVVDRDLVESAMNESRLVKPWQNGQHDMSGFGDILSADVIFIVSQTKGKSFNVYSLEVVEVATGLVVHREHLQDKLLKPEQDFKDLLERAEVVLNAASENIRHQAVTLLPFSPASSLPNGLAFSRLLRAAVQYQIDATPGMISLTREQTSRLIEEKALNGTSGIWGASHMIEGGVSAVENGNIKVALRLESFQGNGSVIKDAEAIGTPEQLPKLAKSAWEHLFHGVAHERDLTGADENQLKNVARNAKEESMRLLREAEWLNAVNAGPDAVMPLVEAAGALGAPPEKVIPLHLDALYRKITSLSGSYHRATPLVEFSKAPEYPSVALVSSDRLAFQLPDVRELLHLTYICFDDFESKYKADIQMDDPKLVERFDANSIIWNSFNALWFAREAIYSKLVPPECREEYRLFCEEMDDLVQRHITIIRWFAPNIALPPKYSLDTSSIREQKKLENFVLNMTPGAREKWLKIAAESSPFGNRSRSRILGECLKSSDHDGNAFCKAKIANFRSMISSGVDARKWTMTCVQNIVQSYSEGSFDYSTNIFRARNNGIDNYTTNEWFATSNPIHGASLLPFLLHNPRMATDYKIRPGNYMAGAYNRYWNSSRLERKEKLSLGSYFNSYAGMAQRQIEDEGVEGYRKSLGSAHLFELLCGLSFSDTVRERHERSIVKEHQRVSAELFKDFRDGETVKSGYLLWHVADRINPNLLWMFQIESMGQTIPDIPELDDRDTDFSNIWLVALDLSNRRIVKKINLKQEAGKALGKNFDDFRIPIWRMAFDQTDDYVMTNFKCIKKASRWPSDEYCLASLVIDKKTGETKTLPKGMLALYDAGHHSTIDHYPVVGLGQEFYFLDHPKHQKTSGRRLDHSDSGCLYRLNPRTMDIKTLVEIGRRPALTPFDADDRHPTSIILNRDELLVGGEKHHAYYNPLTGFEREGNKNTKNIFGNARIRKEIYLENLSKAMPDRQGKFGWKVDSNQSLPGQLQFTSLSSKHRSVIVDYEIPNDFTSKVIVKMERTNSLGRSEIEESRFSDFAKTSKLCLSVLSQTEEDLIIALQMYSGSDVSYPTRNAAYLPFLWRISKNELIQKLGTDSSQ